MKILFTKSTVPLSRLIRAITNEPVSHCALQFDFAGFSIVIHSNLLGVHIDFADNFHRHADVIFELSPTSQEYEQIELEKAKMLLGKYEWSFYDFGALLFLGMSLCLRTYLKVPLPKSNLWQSSGMFICTEWVTEDVDGKQDSMITPYQLYQKLLKTNNWH